MRKTLFYLSVSFLFALLVQSCRVSHTNERSINTKIHPDLVALRDSILQEGLDGEALYTIIGNIKPMSSVASFAFPIGNSDSSKKLMADQLHVDSLHYLKRIKDLQAAINLIDIPDLKFVLVPYRNLYNSTRVLQLSVVRISKLDSLLEAKQLFFGQYGFSAGADPATVVTVNEYEMKYQRLRGYGYLFGYPDYAIDFFVKAFHQSDSTGVHVKRKFFQIPTFERKEGNFVYAYPEDYTPTAVDSLLYDRAGAVLKSYKEVRPKFMQADSTVRAYDLIKSLQVGVK